MSKLKNEDVFKLQEKLLKMSGLWPSRSPTLMGRLWTLTSFIVTYLHSGLTCHSVLVLTDFHQFTRNSTFFLTITIFAIKTTIFYFKRFELLRLLDFIRDPVFQSYHNEQEKHLSRAVKTSAITVKMFYAILIITAVVCFLAPFFKMKHGRELPLDFGLTEAVRESTFLYIALYILQGFGMYFAMHGAIGLEGLQAALMGLVAAQFKIVQGTIVQTTSQLLVNKDEAMALTDYGKFDEEIDRKLRKCVDLHIGIIRFVEKIEGLFTYLFLLQFLVSGFSICVAGFYFILSSHKNFEVLVILGAIGTLLFQISLCCIFGDEVIQQSLKVKDTCYATEWVQCGPKVRKTLFIIMERSKRPSVLTAGGFVNLSIASLVAVLRSAYSYATVLQQLYKK